MKFNKIKEPTSGEKISYIDGVLNVPDNPIIPYIEGDGIGVDITPAMLNVVDNAVKLAYDGKRKIEWNLCQQEIQKITVSKKKVPFSIVL